MDPTNDTTTTGADDAGDFAVGFSPSANARAAALAELEAGGDDDATEPPGEPAEGQGDATELDDEGKPRRREVDAKKLEEEEKARKAKEAEQPTSAAFKKLRREKRDLELLRATTETSKRQVEQLRAQFKERLDKADAFEALEAELKTSPAKVLKRLGIDLSAVNVEWMKGHDPGAEVKTLAEQLAEVQKKLAARDEETTKAAEAQAFETEVASTVDRMAGYAEQFAEDWPAANFFREVDPKDFKAMLREAVLFNAKRNHGTVVGDEVVKMVDEYYKERYAAIQARYPSGSARTSNGTVTPAKLDKGPQALSRAATAPVGSKDPDSYEERWKAALSEL
jgi:hypothetical protein